MAAAGWTPTVENYLGRVPKARILEAVAEAKGERSVQLIAHLKKGDMAKEATRMLRDTGWLPEPLRNTASDPIVEGPSAQPCALPDFLADEDDADEATADPEQPEQPVAAE